MPALRAWLLIGFLLLGTAGAIAYFNGLFIYAFEGLDFFVIIADRQGGMLAEIIGLAGLVSLLIGIARAPIAVRKK